MLAALSVVLVITLSGHLAAACMLRRSGSSDDDPTSGWLPLGTDIAAGLLVNEFLVMILRTFDRVAVVSLVLAAGGLAHAIYRMARNLRIGRRVHPLQWVLFAALAFVVGGQCVAIPLRDWDARSIWFFHAKVMYFAGGMREEAIHHLIDAGFDHPDYPKLVASLGAQTAWLAGFWNEYLPKFAVLVTLLPLLCWTFAFLSAPLGFALLLLGFWIEQSEILTSGYMDGLLAFYGFFAVLFLGRALRKGSLQHLLAGTLALGVTLGLKNEGQLLALSLVVGSVITVVIGMRMPLAIRRPGRLQIGSLFLIIIVTFGGAAAWLALRLLWGVNNDLDIAAGGLYRFLARVESWHDVKLVAWIIRHNNHLQWVIILGTAATLLSLWLDRTLPIETLLAMATGLAYLSGMIAIYFATPYDLLWHLSSSADRTTLVPWALCLVPILVLLERNDLLARLLARLPARLGMGRWA